MTKTTTQAAAFALSALMTLAMAPYGQTHVAMQHVTVVGRRANA